MIGSSACSLYSRYVQTSNNYVARMGPLLRQLFQCWNYCSVRKHTSGLASLLERAKFLSTVPHQQLLRLYEVSSPARKMNGVDVTVIFEDGDFA